ncbi:MAG: ABC transporter permease subunit [Clostridia bacterium]|nr:ABC transporter permease subunit [Clostridia bacterium]
MISLIQNELKKIFKKKSLLITLLVTLAFIILTNVIYKLDFENSYYDYIEEEISFYGEQLKTLDPEKDKDMYAQYKTELEVYQLVKKYDEKSWQAKIIQSEMRSCISNINYFTYQEKSDSGLKIAKAKYNEYIKRLDTDDWRYFAEEEVKEKNTEIDELKAMQEKTTNKLEIKELQSQIRGYEISRQIATWRLEKDIPYGNDYKNNCLNSYMVAMEDIRSYDFGETEKNYDSKKQYYKAQETAAINKYDIENETTVGDTSSAKGILLSTFDEYEIFLIVMFMMTAGVIVSEEFSKGTIKLLLIKPYKRSTILASKFITSIIVAIIVILLVLLMQFVVGGLIQGFDSFKNPTIIYDHTINNVKQINTIQYLAMQALGKAPMYILLMTLAFAFSTIFTNSALAITISLLGYMGSSVINMLALNLKLNWIKYFVTPNWNLTEYFWGGIPTFEGITLPFSIAIIVIYMVIMLVPTFIIFQKKNIKNI